LLNHAVRALQEVLQEGALIDEQLPVDEVEAGRLLGAPEAERVREARRREEAPDARERDPVVGEHERAHVSRGGHRRGEVRIAPVAAEELVAALAREQDLEALRARLPRDRVGGEVMRPRDGLVVVPRELREQLGHLVLGDAHLADVDPEGAPDLAGLGELVVAVRGVAEAEARHRRALRARERRDDPGVDAAARHHAERHVGHELASNRRRQPPREPVGALLVDLEAAPRRRERAPELRDARAPAGHRHRVPRQQLLHGREGGALARDEVEREQLEQILGVEARLDLSGREERFGLRGEEQPAPGAARVVERLHAERVAREEQPPRVRVVEGEREDAVEAGERGLAVADEEPQQRLGVGVAAERDAVGLERGPELRVVVDLAVVDEAVAPVGGRHRLRAGGARIDDREPRVAEPDAGRQPRALAVGPAVADRRQHVLDVLALRRAARDPDDAAHVRCPAARARRMPIPYSCQATAILDPLATLILTPRRAPFRTAATGSSRRRSPPSASA
jgi:hypothetical protein